MELGKSSGSCEDSVCQGGTKNINRKLQVTLANKIYRYWKIDKRYALILYDKLYGLKKNNQEHKPGKTTDIKLIRRLAKMVLDRNFHDPGQVLNETADEVIQYLKERVDTFRWQENQKALTYAKAIIRIGEVRNDPRQKAFGLMVLGDSMAICGDRVEEAWKTQKQGAELYLQCGDLLGWARTTIGRVGICIEMQCIKKTLKDARLSFKIFNRYNQKDFMIRLSINMMRLQFDTGHYVSVINTFRSAHKAAIDLKKKGIQHLWLLYNNVGIAYMNLGEFNQAFDYFILAKKSLLQYNKKADLTVIINNIAYIENLRGDYNKALRLSNTVLARLKGTNSLFVIRNKMDIVDSYLNLNRDSEARDLVQTVIADLSRLGNKSILDLAHARCFLGMAEAKLGMFAKAQNNLLKAKNFFHILGSMTWVCYVELLLGKILLKQGDYRKAGEKAGSSIVYFKKAGQPVNLAKAYQLKAESLIGLKAYKQAALSGRKLLKIAKSKKIFNLCYYAHIIIGRTEEAQGRFLTGREHYNMAITIIEQLQKNLTITIRPDFLEDKCEAIHAQINLLLRENFVQEAFETAERLKAMTILGYLTNRKRLYWSNSNNETQGLIKKLKLVRHDYNCLYKIYRERPLLKEDEPAITTDQLNNRLKVCEDKMRAITDELYLQHAAKNNYIPVKKPCLSTIQAHMADNTLLVEFYSNDENLWVFVIDKKSIHVSKLDVSVIQVDRLLEKYYNNIDYALQEGMTSTAIPGLLRLCRRIGQRLYEALVKPVESYIETGKLLLIVPYGLLHYVPFSTLYNGTNYLIERNEITLLPSAGMITRPRLSRKPGMLVLAHSDNGKIPDTSTEAVVISRMFKSRVFIDKDAVQKHLDFAPVQVLHIAAHGRHRIDQPGLSYISFEDGCLYADDLLQKDLSYELVTLSACETGKIVVKKSEEIIGLIRGILFAGAQSLVLSMWCIDDETTAQYMIYFYSLLKEGKSKAAALRKTQEYFINKKPEMHPAFWGAFQLVGFPGPLSK